MIEVKNITFSYNEGEPALQDVSLTVKKGEFLAVVGHNGSGKSTLAKHFNALLLPTSGQVLVDGMDTANEQYTLSIRQKVGIVFQNPDNQIVTTVVEEDVGFGPENLGVPTEEIVRRVEASLKAVGMAEFSKNAPHLLSGGQKQRVAIAGMLAMRPEVLVLDEATAMLDPQGRKDVLGVVSRLNREEGMTIIMITQYMEEAVEAGRVAVMAGGRIIALDEPRKVFSGEAAGLLRQNRLELPAMAALRDELIAAGVQISPDALTVEEMAGELCQLL